MASRDDIYIAALLHDIGKFWQRDYTSNWNNLVNRETAELLTNIDQNGNPTHDHVLWTFKFLENFQNVFGKIAMLSARHHKPDNEDEAIIQLADWWASGIDRDYQLQSSQSNQFTGSGRRSRQPLGNVFCKVNNGISPHSINLSGFKIHPITINENDFFPTEYDAENANNQELYKNLWSKFVEEFEKLIQFTNIANFLTDDTRKKYFTETLFYLLKKYLWFIPAATNENFPISSLFQHSKITAAIAWCFKVLIDNHPGKFFDYNNNKKRLDLKDDVYPLLLYCVDLSGIQKFLYNISSKHAAKSLRGRSFYLNLLLHDIAREVLHRTNAYQANIVYSSGGKMFLLLPNSEKVIAKLNELEIHLLNKLYENFEKELYVCFGRIAFTYDKNVKDTNKRIRIEGKSENVSFSELWKTVIEEAASQKNKKFAYKFINDFDKFFAPFDIGGNTEICAVTGRELNNNNISKHKDDDETFVVHQEVNHQIQIGSILPKMKYYAITTDKTHTHVKNFSLITKHSIYISDNNNINFEDSEILFVLNQNEPEFIPQTSNNKNVFGFSYFGGSSFPLNKDGSAKTFEDVAKLDNLNKIGVLRMDVDNLGQLFINGFVDSNNDYSSFSNYATLSGMLDLFFSGYINTIREKEEFKDWVTIIYSGGDDLFAVGQWNKIIEFAYEVQKAFKEFTSRKDITLSAGIEIVHPKFPISKVAELSGEAEDKAKSHEYNGQKKNSVCLFNIALNWDKEFEKVIELKNKFFTWLQNEIISRSLLQKILDYYEIQKASPKDLSWKWNATYTIARRIATIKNSPNSREKIEALEEIKKLLFTEISEQRLRFEALAVAIRWAELLYRGIEINEKVEN